MDTDVPHFYTGVITEAEVVAEPENLRVVPERAFQIGDLKDGSGMTSFHLVDYAVSITSLC